MSSSVADLAELGKMWEEHRPRLLVMLRRRIDTVPIEPEAILSDTFLLARRRWQEYKEHSAMTPYAWLYRLALDCLIEEWRRSNRGVRAREMPLPEQSSALLVGAVLRSNTSPSSAAAREECRQEMQQILALLKDNDRDILWLRHYDDLKFKEAAVVLGVSENTAVRRYVRALQRLRELWQQIHPDEEVSG
jgi:RNA polymerase sigma-70 factor (ECF subfamily)